MYRELYKLILVNIRKINKVKKACSYFTIIELMVVFAVMAVLISLLQPSLTKMLKQSEKVICLNNLRQVSTVSRLYQDDQEGAFYQIWHQNPWNFGWHGWGWILADTGYVDLEVESDMLFCPSSVQERQKWYPKYFTYGINQVGHFKGTRLEDVREVVSNPDGSSSDYIYLNRLESPSEYMFIMDTKNSSSLNIGKAMITNYDASWNGRIWQIHDPGLGATVLFGDGHASFSAPEVFYELFGNGLNFAYGDNDSW